MAEGVSFESASDALTLVDGSEPWLSRLLRSLASAREMCASDPGILERVFCFLLSWLPADVDPICLLRFLLWLNFFFFFLSLLAWMVTRHKTDNRYHSWLRRRIHKQD
jgi:hypothetical protein